MAVEGMPRVAMPAADMRATPADPWQRSA